MERSFTTNIVMNILELLSHFLKSKFSNLIYFNNMKIFKIIHQVHHFF